MRDIASVRGLASTEGVIVEWRVAMATRRIEGYMLCFTQTMIDRARERRRGRDGEISKPVDEI